MTIEEDQELLKRFLAHSIEHIISEIDHLSNSVKSLDEVSRKRILGNLTTGEEWRALASDSFTGMVDTLILLGLGDISSLNQP